MPPVQAQACLALSKAAVLTQEAGSRGRSPPSPPAAPSPRGGPLTGEATGLAWAHTAEQHQQDQPGGPGHGQAVTVPRWASPSTTKGPGLPGPGERALLFPGPPTVAMASEGALAESGPLWLLVNAAACPPGHLRVTAHSQRRQMASLRKDEYPTAGRHRWAPSLLRRKHSSGHNLTPSIKPHVFSSLIAADWQEKTAANQSGRSGAEKHPSHSGQPRPHNCPHAVTQRWLPGDWPEGREAAVPETVTVRKSIARAPVGQQDRRLSHSGRDIPAVMTGPPEDRREPRESTFTAGRTDRRHCSPPCTQVRTAPQGPGGDGRHRGAGACLTPAAATLCEKRAFKFGANAAQEVTSSKSPAGLALKPEARVFKVDEGLIRQTGQQRAILADGREAHMPWVRNAGQFSGRERLAWPPARRPVLYPWWVNPWDHELRPSHAQGRQGTGQDQNADGGPAKSLEVEGLGTSSLEDSRLSRTPAGRTDARPHRDGGF